MVIMACPLQFIQGEKAYKLKFSWFRILPFIVYVKFIHSFRYFLWKYWRIGEILDRYNSAVLNIRITKGKKQQDLIGCG